MPRLCSSAVQPAPPTDLAWVAASASRRLSCTPVLVAELVAIVLRRPGGSAWPDVRAAYPACFLRQRCPRASRRAPADDALWLALCAVHASHEQQPTASLARHRFTSGLHAVFTSGSWPQPLHSTTPPPPATCRGTTRRSARRTRTSRIRLAYGRGRATYDFRHRGRTSRSVGLCAQSFGTSGVRRAARAAV